MSSIKDIMSLENVEPLESQAYRRSKDATRSQTSRVETSFDQPFASPSTPGDDDKAKRPVRRRRSSRVSKALSATSRPSTRRRSSAAEGQVMEYHSVYQAGGSNQAAGGANQAGSAQQSTRGSEPASEMPVKYTPVTGRISRAKKGIPVHTCDICRPAKIFTRAEHLRRHQLSHQKPAFPCTFEDCERAFHRQDLLQRHQSQHETQGEKACRSGDPRSRASSSASEGQEPSTNAEAPPHGSLNTAMHTSSPESTIPRTTASDESSMTAPSYSTMSGGITNFSPRGSSKGSKKRSASQAQLQDPDQYPPPSPGTGSTGPARGYTQMTSNYSIQAVTDLGGQDSFIRPSQQGLDQMYSEGGNAHFPNYSSAPHSLPLLRIPEAEESYLSPWCSSASESTYSNSDGSLTGRHLGNRARSASMATVPTQWSPAISSLPQDMRGPPFDSILEQYEAPYASPRMISPMTSRSRLDVPSSFGGCYMESLGTALSTYKPLAQQFPASSPRVSSTRVASNDGGSKELVGFEQLGSNVMSPAQLSPSPVHVDSYIASFWGHFDPLFPIIHKGTKFDGNNLLKFATAALGTQYHKSAEARQKGVELNDYCRRNIDLCPVWNLQTMQAILLTEIFTRFRGRKTNIRFSRQFEALYNRLLSHAADALLETHGNAQNAQQFNDIESEWAHWLENESRQRLLSFCFIFDVHQAMYLEQSRLKTDLEPTDALLVLPCPEPWWTATDGSTWRTKQSGYNTTMQPLRLIQDELLSSSYRFNGTPFSETLLICSLAARLPARDDPTCPHEFLPHAIPPAVNNLAQLFPASPQAHNYLALQYTPLRDLLAIAGDTWVFAKKITPPSAFYSAQMRLKSWSSSQAAAFATQHACHVLQTKLSQPYPAESSDQRTNQLLCISEYWGLYTAALTCWAFGQRYQTLITGSHAASEAPSAQDQARLKALRYTQAMLELRTEDLLTSKASLRGDTSGVLDSVRDRLETVGTGNKCMMLVDAICVLKRITEGGKVKWF